MKLVTASVDTKVRVWNLSKTAAEMKKGKQVKPEHVLEGHVSVPRGVDVSSDGRWLVSGGRDAVVLVWDLAAAVKKGSKGKEKASSEPVLVKTVTTVERVEACGLLSEDAEVAGEESGKGSIRFFTAGEKGMVKVWNGKTGKELARFGEDTAPVASSSAGNAEEQEEQRQVVDAMYVFDARYVVFLPKSLTFFIADTSPTRTLSFPYTPTRIFCTTHYRLRRSPASSSASTTRSSMPHSFIHLHLLHRHRPPTTHTSFSRLTLPSFAFTLPTLSTHASSLATPTSSFACLLRPVEKSSPAEARTVPHDYGLLVHPPRRLLTAGVGNV